MGLITTEVLQQGVMVPQLDEMGLKAYSLAWQQVLAHPKVGLFKTDAVGGEDVLIVKHPIAVPASSAYAVVAFVRWSKFNGDFTPESRTLFEGADDEEILAKIKDFQSRVRLVVAEMITPTYFPGLVGVKYGFNVWPEQLPLSTFVAALG